MEEINRNKNKEGTQGEEDKTNDGEEKEKLNKVE